MKFHQLIKKLRTKEGIGIKQLAPILDLNYTYLSKLENNKSKPSTELIKRFAKYYNYSEDELFLAAGKIPEDILKILDTNPTQAIELLRKEFGRRL